MECQVGLLFTSRYSAIASVTAANLETRPVRSWLFTKTCVQLRIADVPGTVEETSWTSNYTLGAE